MVSRIDKVVHIITGLNDGGAEAVLFRLCTADSISRHHVISLMDGGKYGPLLEAAGVPVTCLGMPQGRVNFSGLLKLWRFLSSEQPRVVQTWMYHSDLVGGVVARLAGVKSVFWGIRHSNLERGEAKSSTILIAHVCARLSGWIPKRIICCAERAKTVHQALGYKADRLLVVPNGYDLQRFSPNASARTKLRLEWGLDDKMPLLGMVGRFDPLKDHENLLRALSLLKSKGLDFRCVLVGRGMDEHNQKLNAWIELYELEEEILLLGQRTDIPAVMCALDIHVLSSCGEAFPNVVAEAMACGTPCITTDVGDASLIVGDTGWVVPPMDDIQLKNALVSALQEYKEPPLWIRRSHFSRERVENNFSLNKMVAAYHAAWSLS